MSPLIGCIADDLTGATDLALTLVRAGLSTTQTVGVPADESEIPDDQAIVVALKSRTIDPKEAVEQSVQTLRSLRKKGVEHFFFKYCSTFDSTDRGNIGPVIEALLAELDADFTIACPAFPTNGRTVYLGHLFVGGKLLEQSSLRDHPLTPMHDSNLVRVLQKQTALKVGLMGYTDVEAGPESIRQQVAKLASEGVQIAIADAVSERQVVDLGYACGYFPLVTGGSAVATGVAKRRLELQEELHGPNSGPPRLDFAAPGGRTAIFAGSCSAATRAQVAVASKELPARQLDVAALLAGEAVVDGVVDWAAEQDDGRPILVYSSATQQQRQATEDAHGKQASGEAVEEALAEIALRLRDEGVTRYIVAGGETSGAIVERLGVNALRIGPEIDPGVPWTTDPTGTMAFALKSGNFGAEDFFLKALKHLP